MVHAGLEPTTSRVPIDVKRMRYQLRQRTVTAEVLIFLYDSQLALFRSGWDVGA